MTARKLKVIGAALGWGAKLHETQNGPEMLKGYGLVPSDWEGVFYPPIRYAKDKKLDYPQRLAQVVAFNQALAKEIEVVLREKKLPVVIGGDHSTAIGTWSAVANDLDGDLGLIWIDAHMDAHTMQTTPSQAIHGMPLAVLLGHGENSLVHLLAESPAVKPRAVKPRAVKPEHVVLIGVRNFEEGEAKLLKRLNVKIYYMDEVKKRGFGAVFEEAIHQVTKGTKGFGVSLDLDGFDPTVAPGVGSPAPDGLQADEVIEAFVGIRKHADLKAFEIAEFNPSLDKDNKTADLIQRVVSAIDESITNEWIVEEKEHCPPNYTPIPVVLTKGEGVWLWDIEGKRYLDMMSAYSAVSFGHCHPRLVRVLHEQAQQLCVTSRAFHTDTLKPFLDKLCEMSHMDSAMPLNTGVEAVEAAIKAARKWGYEKKGIADNKAEIIVASGNFHGRTTTVISFSSDELYKKHFGPLTPGFNEVTFGDVEALKKAITPNTCAFLVEPMQGEAGIVMPKEGWLKACEQICKDNNVLLILDEVQTGLGRTGKLFAFEHEDVKPDGLILGKALGGGILPVSAFLASNDIMQVFAPGTHGSTFGGNPLAARVGLEALRLLEDGELVKHSAQLGEVLLQGLKAIQSPLIKNVRGKGLWVGIEIDPNKVSARHVCEVLLENGILTKETHDTVIRLAPPLIIDKETLKWAIDVVAKTFQSLDKPSI
jgi:ornithine--oxo-acid transaminase